MLHLSALMGSPFSFIKLIWEAATGSQRGSQHHTRKVMKHPSESGGYLPERREEPGIRRALPSGLIPLWADATLTSLNAFCLLSELQLVDACESVRWILRCSDAQTLNDGFHQPGCCPSVQSQGTFLTVQTNPCPLLHLQVSLFYTVFYHASIYGKTGSTSCFFE